MKSRHKRARRQRRRANRAAAMSAWHNAVSGSLVEAKAAGVSLEELNAAMREIREEREYA